jgi:hypothetical protein
MEQRVRDFYVSNVRAPFPTIIKDEDANDLILIKAPLPSRGSLFLTRNLVSTGLCCHSSAQSSERATRTEPPMGMALNV